MIVVGEGAVFVGWKIGLVDFRLEITLVSLEIRSEIWSG